MSFDIDRLPKDPILFGKLFWPEINFYDRQQEIIRSIETNDETYVYAANEMGKDFVAGFTAPRFFATRHPCRILTTSAKADHLRVLWGEIMAFINTSSLPGRREHKGVLRVENGGFIICNHQDLRKLWNGERCPKSYCLGMVASQESQAALGGHHIADQGDGIPRTLIIGDEASGIPHYYKDKVDPWAVRQLWIGNCWPCNNFFRHGRHGNPATGDRGGDRRRPYGLGGFYRKILHIPAQASPNIQCALEEIRVGMVPTGRMLVPGVKSYVKYTANRRNWDKVKQTIALDAEFYQGAEILLFPPDWLDRAERYAQSLAGHPRSARAIGIDPAEGGDRTAMAAVDERGIIEIVSKRTPNTAVITEEALAFMNRHKVPPERVVFDRGGGGKQHADTLREKGYRVRTVGFGEHPQLELKHGLHPLETRKDTKESAYEYINMRAQLYGELSELLDPSLGGLMGQGFAIPFGCGADPADQDRQGIRGQLCVVPKAYEEGRLKLPPKDRPRGQERNEDKPTLIELIGHSPDEADALVLAVHGMLHKAPRAKAGIVK